MAASEGDGRRAEGYGELSLRLESAVRKADVDELRAVVGEATASDALVGRASNVPHWVYLTLKHPNTVIVYGDRQERDRVIRALWGLGMSHEQIAACLNVGKATVHRVQGRDTEGSTIGLDGRRHARARRREPHPRKRRDLTGQTFGALVVEGPAEDRGGRAYWRARCTCGSVTEVRGDNLTTGRTSTCGHGQGKAVRNPIIPAGHPWHAEGVSAEVRLTAKRARIEAEAAERRRNGL